MRNDFTGVCLFNNIKKMAKINLVEYQVLIHGFKEYKPKNSGSEFSWYRRNFCKHKLINNLHVIIDREAGTNNLFIYVWCKEVDMSDNDVCFIQLKYSRKNLEKIINFCKNK